MLKHCETFQVVNDGTDCNMKLVTKREESRAVNVVKMMYVI